MEVPYWLRSYTQPNNNSISLEEDEDNTTILNYSGLLEIGKGIISLKLDTPLNLVRKNLGNTLITQALLSYLCTYDSFLQWNQSVLSKEIQAELAINTLINVMSYVLDLGSELDLREVCASITFLSDYMLEIEYIEN